MEAPEPEQVDFITQRLAETYAPRIPPGGTHGSRGEASRTRTNQSVLDLRADQQKKRAPMALYEADQRHNGMNHKLYLAVRKSTQLNDDQQLESILASRIRNSQRPINTTRPMGSALSAAGVGSLYDQPGSMHSSHLASSGIHRGVASSQLSTSGLNTSRGQVQGNRQGSRSEQRLNRSAQGTMGRSMGYHDGTVITVSHEGAKIPPLPAYMLEAMENNPEPQKNGVRTEEDLNVDMLSYSPHIRPLQKTITANRFNDGLKVLREANLRYGLGNMEPNSRPILVNSALTVPGIVQPIQSVLSEQMMIASSDISLTMKELTLSSAGINTRGLSEKEREDINTQYIAFGTVKPHTSTAPKGGVSVKKTPQTARTKIETLRSARLRKGLSNSGVGAQELDAETTISSAIKRKKARELQQKFPDVYITGANEGSLASFEGAKIVDNTQHLRGFSSTVTTSQTSKSGISMTRSRLGQSSRVDFRDDPEELSLSNLNVNESNDEILADDPLEEDPEQRVDSGFNAVFGYRPPNTLAQSSAKARVDLDGNLEGGQKWKTRHS
ncbi:hypothetical protein GMRT_11496 [Giardia muris]|uniref:Uncharacterized protein n=1 Tax=Giardia muris TaxID=5742 RepID=A0A4Z1SW21_GIAMU|nr:hypothetical protein GMRT_11496 [Giardia muris]|eukprot:TNJ29800.1 hypothetical protein GMRT_11496 [Giardia muris]